MIDIHSHILPGIDDGSRDFEESIKLLDEAKNAGFDKIVSTSHYALDLYECPEYKRIDLINKLREEVHIPDILLGSEIYSTHTIIDLLNEGKASRINGTRYVLFEIPLVTSFPDLPGLINKIKENGYFPILAHPERYWSIQKNFDILYELQSNGVYFQGNYASILGYYGPRAKKVMKRMLKEEMYTFLGTDVHRANTIYPKMDKIIHKMSKLVSDDYLDDITTNNAELMLGDNII